MKELPERVGDVERVLQTLCQGQSDDAPDATAIEAEERRHDRRRLDAQRGGRAEPTYEATVDLERIDTGRRSIILGQTVFADDVSAP